MWWMSIDWEKIANAAVILITGTVAAFALRRGKTAPTGPVIQDSPQVELAGALVDTKSLKALATHVEAHTVALAETRSVMRTMTTELERGRDGIEDFSREVVALREEIREHRNELARQR